MDGNLSSKHMGLYILIMLTTGIQSLSVPFRFSQSSHPNGLTMRAIANLMVLTIHFAPPVLSLSNTV